MNLTVCFWHFDRSSGNWTRTSDLRVMSLEVTYIIPYQNQSNTMIIRVLNIF